MKSKRLYVAAPIGGDAYEVIRTSEPTELFWGNRYALLIGPFRTRAGADFMAQYGRNNPHCQTVAQAERLALGVHLSHEVARELHYLDPQDDGLWVRVYQVALENKPSEEWWWASLADIARSCDRTVAELKADAQGDPMSRARVYEDIADYMGWCELAGDSYERMREADARVMYRPEMEHLKS